MTDERRKVCVVLVNRSNYGRLKPVMKAIQERPSLLLQTVVTGTMELRRFEEPVQEVERDGFAINGTIHMELEGSTPVTMAKSIGIGVTGFASEFDRLVACRSEFVTTDAAFGV